MTDRKQICGPRCACQEDKIEEREDEGGGR